MKYLEVKTTTGKKEEAEKIAEALLDAGAAACVQIGGPVESHFMWKGKREVEKEFVLSIKTTGDKYDECERIIKENHSYETPEIIAIEIMNGSIGYLNWLEEQINK